MSVAWHTRGTVIAAEYRPPWTGITEPRCDFCTWAWHRGRMELKFLNRICTVHARLMAP